MRTLPESTSTRGARRDRRRRRIAACAALALLASLGGCASSAQDSGIRIGDKTLGQFKAGKTTENWVLAILGPPTTRADVAGESDVHVLRYSLLQREDPGLLGSIFGGQERANVATVYFIVRGDVVESFWADRVEGGGLFDHGEKSGEKSKD